MPAQAGIRKADRPSHKNKTRYQMPACAGMAVCVSTPDITPSLKPLCNCTGPCEYLIKNEFARCGKIGLAKKIKSRIIRLPLS